MAYSDNEGLGIGVTTLASVAGSLFAKDKNPGRLAANKRAYDIAVSGNGEMRDADGKLLGMSGLEFLRQKSVPGAWATMVATNDAKAKYAAAQAVIAKQGSAAPKPAGGAQTTSIFGGTVGGAPVVAGMSFPPLLLAGAAAAGIYFLTKRR